MTQLVKFFLFDVGNVLVKADVGITYRRLQELGVPKEKQKLFYENEAYEEFERGKISAKGFCKAATKLTGTKISLKTAQEIHDKHLYGVDGEVLQIISCLPRQNVIFVTDSNEWQTRRVEKELVALEKLGKVFRSHELGVMKKDGGFFEKVLEELDAMPHEVLLIDDGPEKIAKAKQLGMQTILFKNTARLRKELRKLGALK